MGKLSELQIEQEFVSDFWMTCPNCHEEVSEKVRVPEPNWSEPDDISGLNSEGTSELHCPNCDKHFECFISFTHGNCDVSLTEHPETNVSADNPSFFPSIEDWVFEETAADPLSSFKETIKQVRSIAIEANETDGSSVLNRMCFSQVVSVFEAYLSDTLVNAVQNDTEKLKKLVQGDKELSKVKVGLGDVLKNPAIVNAEVKKHLRSLVYHNLPRIDPIYRMAFGVSLLDDENRSRTLMEYMSDRHDCVHRNGRTKEGDAPEKFTLSFFLNAAKEFEDLVIGLEKEINAKKPNEQNLMTYLGDEIEDFPL